MEITVMANDAERDGLVLSLVESALELPAGDRERHLRSVCPDPALYEEVRRRVERAAAEIAGFGAGSYVSERFRIVRAVGHGGMGVVYEAMDEKLDRRVALKCAKPGYRHRLPPEARTAREVSHYNVCKVHDLHQAATPQGEMEFLSMEFIEGQTLAERIKREGPLAEAEAREIARQICAGLAQAHRQGVIHGDLKPNNILLAETPEGGVRAVITDFGLAKMKHGEGGSGIMSDRGGTLDYMAPELLQGERATVASDLYALGVLLHVLRAGSAPVPAADAAASTVTLGRGIVEAEWERKVGDLPGPWKKVVTRCMAPRPENRFGSAEEVGEALEPRRRRAAWAAAGTTLVAALLFGYWQWTAAPSGPPVRLAVLPFVVEGEAPPGAAGIGIDVADRLSGVRRNFTVISPREAERNQVDTPEKARSTLGATHVLETRLRTTGEQIVAVSLLKELESGRTLRQLNGTYGAGDTPGLAKAILATVTGAFRLREGVPRESVNTAAYPAYVRGIELLRRDDRNADEVIPYFTKAIELDSGSALPYAGLAEAQMKKFALGDGRQWLERAGASVAKARSVNSDSAPVLLVSGFYEQQNGRYERAIADLTRATELEPGNSEAWRRLAVAYEKANRSEEAVATYRKAIAAQPNYYRHYLDFGNYYLVRSDFRKAEELYRRVTDVAPEFANGHMSLGLALMQQGRFGEAEAAMLKALRMEKSAVLLLNLGALYYGQGRYPEAARYFEESLASGPPTVARFRNLGDAYRHLGRGHEAAEAYRQGRSLAESDVARNPRQASSRALLALLSAFLGDAERAQFELAQALAMEPENALVRRDGVIAYEVLRQREKSLELLREAPPHLLEELTRQPDVEEMRRDPRFQELIRKKPDR